MEASVCELSNMLRGDLLMQVLSRLPGKSLLRFKCVSKDWFFLITSPYFVDLFLRCQTSCNSSALFVVPRWTNAFHIVNWNDYRTIPKRDVESHGKHSRLWYNTTNPVNVLVCFFYCENFEGFSYFMYNITTREELSIREAKIFRSACDRRFYLGFDPTNNQYKLICTNLPSTETKLECQVLTLGSKSVNTWRHVHIDANEDFLANYDKTDRGFCYDGVIYWRCWNCAKQVHDVAAMNVARETLEFLGCPQQVKSKVSVCQVGGYVSVVEFPILSDSPNIILWCLKGKFWIERVISCPMFMFKGEKVFCTDSGLLTLVC